MKCKICSNENNNKQYYFKEMMFGLEEEFLYYQCSKCNCLQINKIPENMTNYYPQNYYSFSGFPKRKKIKRQIKSLKDNYALFKKGFIGKILFCLKPNHDLRELAYLNLKKTDRIMDVGCGSGYLLYSLKELGFETVLGVDPFIEKDIVYPNGLKILKKDLSDITGEWDLIMFHHSFEHISNPADIIKHVSQKLSNKGRCLIRIPTVSSYAWEHYRENWVQLDAPRHFFLHSKESIAYLAEKYGLSLNQVKYDSKSFQFWGSEQYKAGITLNAENSYLQNPKQSIFTKTQIKEFDKKAKQFNKNNQGDQAAFLLTKK